jgi:hypothetical protein
MRFWNAVKRSTIASQPLGAKDHSAKLFFTPLQTVPAEQSGAEFVSLWAGQGVRMARRQTSVELVAWPAKEISAIPDASRKFVPAS